MKKYLSILFCLLIIFGCKSKTFLDYAQSDYVNSIKEIKDSVFLYKIEAILNKPLSSLKEEDIYIQESRTIIKEDSTATQIYRTFKNKTLLFQNKSVTNGFWWTSKKIYPHVIKYDFKDALNILKKSDVYLPESNYMEFRRSYYPPYMPVYIFGSDSIFISVNAITGEIETIYETKQIY